jgi:hypothetical protein
VAPECDGPVRDIVKAVCPLQCQLRHGPASDNPSSDQASRGDRVDWAGFPIDLDLAFSQRQRDKVYAQHLMRMRGAQLRRWLPNCAQLCVCETATDHGRVDLDAAQDYVRS